MPATLVPTVTPNSTVKRTVTLNAAFMREIKEDNERLRDLKYQLEAVFHRDRLLGISRFALAELLGEFRDQLATHFALEEAFGYFDDPVVDVAPHLSEHVDALRSEHADIFQDVCRLADDADDVLRRQPDIEDFCELADRFCELDAWLARHEADENELIMNAFNADIGVGD